MRHSGLRNKVTRAWIVTDGIRLKNVTDLLRRYAAIEEYVFAIGLLLDLEVFHIRVDERFVDDTKTDQIAKIDCETLVKALIFSLRCSGYETRRACQQRVGSDSAAYS